MHLLPLEELRRRTRRIGDAVAAACPGVSRRTLFKAVGVAPAHKAAVRWRDAYQSVLYIEPVTVPATAARRWEMMPLMKTSPALYEERTSGALAT
jgi:hypothetical protein